MTLTPLDRAINSFDRALRTLSNSLASGRPSPGAIHQETLQQSSERQHVAGLMRVNHSGEVCAQALYQGQWLFCRDPQLAEKLQQAAREEEDHLAWTKERLTQLNAGTSWLNPLWYAGSFAIGSFASLLGNQLNLGFLVETEKQVEQHLTSHLDRLPEHDDKSRAILEQMRQDEVQHAQMAEAEGGKPLPLPVQLGMKLTAKIMTTVAYRI